MPFSPQTTEIRLNNLEGQKTMAKTQHTPGPWKVEFSQISAPDEKKCIVQFGFNIRENPQALANARLIAASPDLLGALKDVMQTFVGDDQNEVAQRARAAIAKAAGE